MYLVDTLPRNWWPHPDFRRAAYWRGKAWLFRVVPEATLEFADRTEVYELSETEFESLRSMSYHDCIATLLRRQPDRVQDKVDWLTKLQR